MKKELLSLALVGALVAAPLASANARGWDHGGGWDHDWHGGGWHDGWHHDGGGLLFGLGAAVGAAATIIAAPFEAVAPPPVPVYAAPPPVVYAPPPAYYGYYAPRPVTYYPGYYRGYYGYRYY